PFKADNNYMLVFDDKEQRFGGRGECNSILGKYTLNDAAKGKIKLESIGSTRAMCPNQAQEDQFIRDLDRVDTYRIDGDLLMLLHNGELVMILEAQATEMK
ncbi:MAG: META domain-containing protein, partial [Alistipes sp.]|nr:META domain-containing protein [Alistipes sp.]